MRQDTSEKIKGSEDNIGVNDSKTSHGTSECQIKRRRSKKNVWCLRGVLQQELKVVFEDYVEGVVIIE